MRGDGPTDPVDEVPADGVADQLAIAFVPGVTLTKWTRAWRERRPDAPLAVTEVAESEQVVALHDGRAHLSFVRLPIDSHGLNVIPLYREVAVAVAAKDHAIAAADSLVLADLAAGQVKTGSNFSRADFDLVAAGVGILIVPHSIARLQSRKDLVARPVTDAAETQIAVAWRAGPQSEPLASRIEEFIGIVRGRTARSSRTPAESGDAPAAKSKQATSPAKQAAKSKAGRSGTGAAFAQQRKNAAARKKHRGR
ncbi:LysR substrate-binding domain-containing protein [Parafrigoribacterium soli]|uniref:LysR substrate-binding domain-containing protein n=1 Tax=Parafrigoribacterium soli TaxID=3144663 RepID=UPI0032ED0DFA